MANNETELYSFDIFDTLLTRKVAQPKGIFVLMQSIIKQDNKFADIGPDVKENFVNYRINAEYRQRRISITCKDAAEITFDDIYNDLKETLFLSDRQINYLKMLEIQTELDNIIPIEENINKVKELLAQGKRVVLISDMYLPESVVRQILCKADPVLNSIKLYLSSNHGYTKAHKTLFEFVKNEENVNYSAWQHIGDNCKTDYTNASELGIQTQRYQFPDLTKYEKRQLNLNFYNPSVWLLIGCARNTRLKYGGSTNFDIGVSLGGVILYSYVVWLLNQAQKRSIDSLLFIARDGYILKKIADYLIKQKNLNIKTYYVYGSRKTWILPPLDLKNIPMKEQFINGYMCWYHKKLDSLLELTDKEIKELIPSKFHKYKKGLNSNELEEFKNFLLNNDDLLKTVTEKQNIKKIRALNYLKQVIEPVKDKNFAFVDIDGTRYTMNCMSALIHEFYDKKLCAFYLANTPTVYEGIDIDYICCTAIKQAYTGVLVELLAKAPHGQTIGFQEIEGKWEPVFEETPLSSKSKFNFDEYLNGVTAFSCEMNKYENDYKNICFCNLSIIDEYITFLRKNIDKKTADILGSIPHSLYGNELKEFALKIRIWHILKYFLTHKFETENILYSRARSGKCARKILDIMQKAGLIK